MKRDFDTPLVSSTLSEKSDRKKAQSLEKDEVVPFSFITFLLMQILSNLEYHSWLDIKVAHETNEYLIPFAFLMDMRHGITAKMPFMDIMKMQSAGEYAISLIR